MLAHPTRWRNWMAANLDATLALSDDQLERRHDYIQWLSPGDEPSPHNPDAPVITAREMRELVGQHPELRDGLQRALARMLSFYGLVLADGRATVAANWQARRSNWADKVTHNDRRLSRILKALYAAGLDAEGDALLRFLLDTFDGKPERAASVSHWRWAKRRSNA